MDVCVFSVCVLCRQRPCCGMIMRPKSHTICLRFIISELILNRNTSDGLIGQCGGRRRRGGRGRRRRRQSQNSGSNIDETDSSEKSKKLSPCFNYTPYHDYLSIYGSTALRWISAAFSVSWSFPQSVGLLGRGISPSQGRYLHTEQHKHRINAHIHPCLEWNSNPRSQCLSVRRRFIPQTARPLLIPCHDYVLAKCSRLIRNLVHACVRLYNAMKMKRRVEVQT
jgi:hypothetical protein